MIDPRNMTVTEWCDAASHTLRRYGVIPLLLSPNGWQQWVVELLQLPQISRYAPPDPRGFSSWEEWVFRFNQAVPY
jgi:hypothetical protein